MASADDPKFVQMSSDESPLIVCGPCRYDVEMKEATIYCLQCNDYLCPSCRSVHRKLPVSRDHQLVAGTAKQRRDVPEADISNKIDSHRFTGLTIRRPSIADMNVKTFKKVDVRVSNDHERPLISGLVFMPSGELVLCDRTNKSVKVFSVDFTFKEQIKLASKPFGIDRIADDEVVISLPTVKCLTFVKVFPILQFGSSIQLDQSCLGVAVDGESIVVSFENGEVRILDRAGNQLKTTYNSLKFSLPYCISVLRPGMLLVSNHTGNTVQLFNNGQEVYTYKHSELRYPLGMYIDGEDNALICGYHSHNVHVIDNAGKYKRIFLSENDGLNYPNTISFRPIDNILVVGGDTSDLVIFKLG